MGAKLAECVLLADRHPGLTEGVRGLLESVADMVVMVADEASLLESASRLDPALVVADLSLGREVGLGWLTRLRARASRARVIVLSVHDEPGVMRAAFRAGADGFVVKRSIARELLPAVTAVLTGERFPAAHGDRA